ncbi:cell envelope biogenesis protein TolA [Sphingomonas sp. Sph1(2015)]|jgi:outer membrane biosynthesis protein TonB|uniref:cell envelope biogenesis protein TolA n=1 Tax=Sphingomonas sp. Sph1(2015) TaxID=1628084 RepID=UPI00097597C9|nr:cell envelope biogenesis protein TolA [Sphingomonas sp. Sph1(2015)]OMJ32122.1 cell envelope biogenesis protein TolA [Sphingomonas sp. Sph1(2015)]
MERGERTGLAIAVAGHIVLFGLLSVGFLSTPNPEKLKVTPIDISLVKDVALDAASPTPNQQAAQSVAPEEGAPEDAAPPEPVEAEPEPQPAPPPPAPQPKPQPKPQPRPEPKPEPAPKPRPVPKPEPKPKPVERPQPKPQPKSKPAPAKPAPAKPVREAKPAPTRPTRSEAKPAAAPKPTTPARGSGKSETAKTTRPRGSHLGADFLKGLSADPSPSKSQAAPAARIGAQQLANIASAILRQVQPCANRQVTPGPGAERIRVAINLHLNKDGSLAAAPRVVGHSGVDGENERYVDRVDDLAIATFKGCSPLRGLPAELYDVPGGWSNFTLRYKLPG